MLAVAAVLLDVCQGAAVHDGVLTELHLHHVEAKRLRLPDERLHGAVGRAGGAAGDERALDDAQVLEELVAGVVHRVGVAHDRGLQAVCHDEHDGAVRLGLADELGAGRELLAHLDLVVPHVDELAGRLGVVLVEREVAAHTPALVLERGHHVREELRGYCAAHLGGDVGVAVAVGADPGAGVEERRAHRGHAARVVTEHPVVEAAVDLGHHVEQRVVEDVDDRIGLFDGRGLLEGDGARAQQRVDLLEHVALVLGEVGATQARMLLEKARDAADLALDGLAAGLRGVRGEDGVELETPKKLLGAILAGLLHELVVGHGKRVALVGLGVEGDLALAVVERLHAEVLLGEVRQVEVGGEGARDHRLLLDGEATHELVGVAEVLVLLGGARGAHDAALIGGDEVQEKLVERGAELGRVLAEHLAQKAQEQLEVVTKAVRKLHAGKRARGGQACLGA